MIEPMSHRILPAPAAPAPRQLAALLRWGSIAWALLALGAAWAGPREDLIAAEAALAKGDRAQFEVLAAGLVDYPLYPYLRFAALMADLPAADPAAIEGFLADYADSPLAERLRSAWLERLAAAGRWEEYLRLSVPSESPAARCHQLSALLALGRTEEALAQVEPLWRTGESRPKACDGVFDAWRAAGRLTPELVWARIELALEAGGTGLARYLGRDLPEGEQGWLRRWLSAQEDPQRTLAEGLPEGHPLRARILLTAIERLAATSPERAAAAWDGLAAAEAWPAGLAARADAAVGLALAEAGDPRGLDYLGRVPEQDHDLAFHERRLRAALALGDWARVAAWVAVMPEGETKREQWLYWQARALEALGEGESAHALYREAAAERSLWGFLAAERSGEPYRLQSCPTPAEPERIAWLIESAAGRRIAELRALGREPDARREWLYLTRRLDQADLAAAAVLAERWGWPDQAIATLARSGWWDDLGLRFPLHYRGLVAEQARANGLAEAWVYAVLRQESAFNPQAVSSAGARGLMQLMPATARDLIGDPATAAQPEDLHEPALNIALGSRYLARMERRFGGHPALAAAAYNAGPARVARWLPERAVEADVWIATIPYRETRGYVRRVLAYRLIYQGRLGEPITPLAELLRPIGGAGQQAQVEPSGSEG